VTVGDTAAAGAAVSIVAEASPVLLAMAPSGAVPDDCEQQLGEAQLLHATKPH
jgi:hypothetical protein